MTGSPVPIRVPAPRIGRAWDGFVADDRPRVSWRAETTVPDWTQGDAEIACERAGDRAVARIDGSRSHAVAWPFTPLRPAERVRVSIRVSGSDGSRSPWSPVTEVTAAFLPDDGWKARFVGSGEATPHLLRGTFTLRGEVERALLYGTARGVYDVRVNGHRADDAELKPGWTSYQWRLGLDTADVTAYLSPGTNVLGVELAGGWFTERFGFRDAARRFYEGPPAAAVQLVVTYRDGTTDTVLSDEGWRWAPGPVVSSGLYQGETHDARRHLPGWAEPGFDDDAWSPVRVVEDADPTPRPLGVPPVRVVERRSVERVITTPSGRTVLDFGQNLVGRLRIRVCGERGHTVTLRHAEVLEHGELGTRPLRNAAATDTYVLAGDDEETWEPQWTYHGFRYAEIENWPGEFEPDMVTASVLHTDMPRTGGFRTSHALVQRFHDNVVWSMRGNFLSIPTDCPQRDERLGWTGDIQVFAPTAALLYDCDAFLASWLQDVLVEQRAAGGVVPMVVPAVIPQVPGLFAPIAAWGDAITVVPSVLWERFADEDVLRDCYEGMRTWVDLVAGRTGESLLWDRGQQFGDWVDPDAPPDQPGAAKVDPAIVATAYFQRSARLTAHAAEHLGRHDDAARYADLASRVATAFRDAFVTPRGRMMSDAPTAYALAIAFDLVDGDTRAAMGARLRDLVRAAGYRISTGFAGTPVICEALTATGHHSAAARLLTQTECPSWLYPVTMGATTVWERWDSMLEDGSINPGQMTSFNHYALGGMADWLHRTVAGLTPGEPGYRTIHIAPTPMHGLDDAEARHETPYGRAVAGWRRTGREIHVHAEVPPNTRAVVVLPSGTTHEVGSGTHSWTEAAAAPDHVRGTLSLDSDLATIMDDQEAYATVMGAIRALEPGRAEAFRSSTRWTAGRSLREPLDKAPLPVLEAVGKALANLS